MADLTVIEKSRLERALGMGGGYVLDFSNRTFREFIFESVGKDIYGGSYDNGSCSKANRLRQFWAVEPNHVVAKLIGDFVKLCKEQGGQATDLRNCADIADRLRESAQVPDADALTSAPEASKDFELLAQELRIAIDDNQPEKALDRLHTYMVKVIRGFAQKRGVVSDKDKPLHSLFGEYVKCLQRDGLVTSTMSERILKSAISLLDAFNTVRNDQSFAHDNPILNYDESLLIFNSVASTIRFVRSIESRSDREAQAAAAAKTHSEPAPCWSEDDIPF